MTRIAIKKTMAVAMTLMMILSLVQVPVFADNVDAGDDTGISPTGAETTPGDIKVTNLGQIMQDADNWETVSMDAASSMTPALFNMVFGAPQQQVNGTGTWASHLVYAKPIPSDTAWAFDMQLNTLGSDAQFGFKARTTALASDTYTPRMYYVRYSSANGGTLQLRRSNPDWTETTLAEVPNDGLLAVNAKEEIVVGAIDVDGGVRLVFEINGVSVFDVVDTGADFAPADGEKAGYPAITDQSQGFELYFQGLTGQTGGTANNAQITPANTDTYPITPLDTGSGTAGDYQLTNINTLMKSDAIANWQAHPSSTGDRVDASNRSVILTPGAQNTAVNWSNSFSYMQPVDRNAVWAFKGKIDALGGGWIGFQLRAKKPLVDDSSTTDYFFRLAGDRSQWDLYRVTNGAEQKIVASVANAAAKPGVVQNYELGSLDVDGGVRLILKIAGKTVFDIVDTGASYGDPAPEPVAPIDQDGYLTVNMYGMTGSAFTISPADGPVKSVTVDPVKLDVGKGGNASFAAAVSVAEGSGASTDVTWSVQGNTSAGTAITSDGVLTVSADEGAGVLTVVAASVEDELQSGTAMVIIPENFAYGPSELYVSPDGSDTNDGSIGSPFHTLQKAKDAVRAYMANEMVPAGGITVYLRGGEYVIASTVDFEAADSGTADKPVTYKAYDGENVIFSGAQTIPGSAFAPVTDPSVKARLYPNVADGVMQVDLNALGIPSSQWGSIRRASPNTLDDPDSTQMYVDDMRQTLSQWPNQGYAETGKITAPQGSAGATFSYADSQLIPETADRWAQADQAWASGYWYWDWFNDSMPVTANTSDRTLTLGSTSDYGVARDKRFYVFNLLEEIDKPGEWFLDRDTGILYYYPTTDDLAASHIQLATLDKNMILVNGANYLSFEGLTFEATSAAAFTIRNADHVVVAGSTFRNLGGKVADMKGTTNSGFTGNDIYDLSKGGIYIDSSGDKANLTASGDYVTNNYFSRFNLVSRTYTPAISVKTGAVGARVANNVIHDGPHAGLLVGGANNVFENNELYDLVSESDDAGAIYGGRNWTDVNLTFRNNLMHDITGLAGKNSAYGIYFDDNMGGEVIQSNMFYNVKTPVFGHGSWGNRIDSNVFVNSATPISIINYNWNQGNQDQMVGQYDAIGQDNPAWNAAYPWWSARGDAINALNPRGVGRSDEMNSAKDNVVTNNVSYDSGAFNIASSAQPTLIQQDNVTLPDAGAFNDPSVHDYSLPQAPPGIGSGFVSPDYASIGQYIDQYRSSIFVMNDFSLTYPFNGTTDVQTYKLDLMWNHAVGATDYNVVVATDPGLANVVFTGTTKNTSIEVEGLEYGGKTYYWQVEAVGASAKNPIRKLDENGVYSFTTALNEIADTLLLSAQIAVSQNYLGSVTVGTATGEYPQAAYDAFAAIIADAQALMAEPNVPQTTIDAKIQSLKDGMDTMETARISGLVDLSTLMDDASGWKTSSGAQFNLAGAPNETIAFTGSYLGFEGHELPNYAVWHFKMQLGSPGDGWNNDWFAISLRNSNTIGDPWGATNYLLGFKQDVFELQKFGGASSLGDYQVPNDGIFELGKEYDMQYGVLNTAAGTRIIVKIDGTTIYDYLDNYDGTTNSNIPVSGYLGFHLYGGLSALPLKLSPGGEAAPATTDKAALSTAIQTANGLHEADYSAASWTALQDALAAANAANEDGDATQTDVDDAAAALQAAMNGLAPAVTEQSAAQIAAGIAGIAAPAKDATALTLPSVPAGYTVAIKSSSDPSVIGTDGSVTPPSAEATIQLVLEVTRTSDGTKAVTGMLAVTVPEKTYVNPGTGTGTGTETGTGTGTGTGTTNTGSKPTADKPVFNEKVIVAVIKEIWAREQSATSVAFSDVAAASWSASLIERAAKIGIVNGYEDGSFRPDAPITRAEFAAMLVKALGLQPRGASAFTDTEGHWASGAIGILRSNGLSVGYGDGTFHPDQEITRAEIVAMLARVTDYVTPAKPLFSDLNGNWASDEINAFAAAGIVNGSGDGTFAPNSPASRAESVAMIIRMLETVLAD
ncbi:S-layer homology domain-containing protein [Paenibacillus sacheonensis]|uniref:SLH domain-containing protein n=1 Tax=Paenibacillus sacheonensis TaxID=742054 RepID=A0A7X4YM38_9BACL|nr:S-layer homology domain-containing protein [Paenibacillus sacheonensis]MBM7565792.1 hypothetical protein [Paenibacillus sacheonensis]NBC68887.1 hypothetical protein [Paenibacillus sacheonensis]